jgi:hypothetical protein
MLANVANRRWFRALGLSLWLRWVLASGAVGLLTGWTFFQVGSAAISRNRDVGSGAVEAYLVLLSLGFIWSVPQSPVLWRSLRGLALWVVGSACAWPVGLVLDRELSPAWLRAGWNQAGGYWCLGDILGAAALLTVVQFVVLRRSGLTAGPWAVAGLGAWAAISLPVHWIFSAAPRVYMDNYAFPVLPGWLVSPPIPAGWPWNLPLLLCSVGFAAGVIYGAITGLGLVWLVRDRLSARRP